MANSYRILGSSAPSAAALTTAYTVASATQSVISTITVANRSAVGTSFRIAIAAAGGAAGNGEYIAYDVPIGGNQTIILNKLGITMDTTDEVQVYATLATLSFNIFGVEIS
jgi:hypothetical protein